MRKMTHLAGGNSAKAAVVALVLCVAPPLAAASHPRLVNLATTRCETCHGEITGGFATVHPPVADDCTSCHDLIIADEGTTVELSEQEPALCVMCHDGLEAAAAGELESSHAPVTDSCLSCHVPHASAETALLAAPITELCAMCHDIDGLLEVHGGQITTAVNCTSCHRPHGSEHSKMLLAGRLHAPFADGSCESCHREPFADRIRLRARGAKVCAACHGEMTGEAGEHGTIHSALTGSRRRAGCLSCHEPHVSENNALLTEAGPDVCLTCHGEVVEAARADTGHAPAAEDCLNCHRPHASPQQYLLVDATPDLCVICHDAEDPDLAAAHLGADPAGLDCITCHSPHGAGHEKLLARNVHSPIVDGCDTCHEGAADKLMEDGESTLCLVCHDDIGEAAENAAVQHPALEMIRCADCHNPHASPQERLVNQPAGGECTVCHEDQAAGEGEFAHGVIELIGCRACHEPHGSANETLLRDTGNELCLACHEAGRTHPSGEANVVLLLDRFAVAAHTVENTASLVLTNNRTRNHPTTNHRVSGVPTHDELARFESSFLGELSCLTCHDPHKGRSRLLFRWGAASAGEACQHCHEK